jgi:hypothetical protein
VTPKLIEETILNATDKTSPQVKVLGLALNCKAADLHIYLDGVDITKNVVWGELKITFEKKQ